MQENHNKPLKKFISFFKNKFNIFKNKITPTSKQQSNALNHTSPSNNHPIDECYINIKDNNNSNTKITETKTKTKIETDIITITTTMTTVTTIQNTRANETDPDQDQDQEKEKENDQNITTNNDYTQFIDESKYSRNIISSLLDNIIDDIEVEDYISNKRNREKYQKKMSEFYDEQHNYSNLQTTLKPYIFNEFEEIVSKILTPDSRFLTRLCQLKIYRGDLIDSFTRYGVFETNNFIIKIDDESDIFIPELEVMYHIGQGIIYPYNIVLPYYVHTIIKSNDNQNPNQQNKLMHFSIQPRIRNTVALHKWLRLSNNRFYNITYYIKMCITISKSILYMHSHNIVHGDIKPDNILIDISSNIPYIIDFGLSGIHRISQGTGGTRPFCYPETKNISSNNSSGYVWTKNNKQYDLWSIAFIFSTIIIFKKAFNYYDDYPKNHFDKDKYVNAKILNTIPVPFRDPFMLVLCKKSDINLSQFIRLLEDAVMIEQMPHLNYYYQNHRY
jgi:hypothetical protein